MIEITKYLQTVYEDLQRYVDNDVCLCKFKELNFEAGALPDYEDINIQQLYLLRYAFAYAFEYSRMYLDVLSQMDGVNGISVTSVGCGSMIDYWSWEPFFMPFCTVAGPYSQHMRIGLE